MNRFGLLSLLLAFTAPTLYAEQTNSVLVTKQYTVSDEMCRHVCSEIKTASEGRENLEALDDAMEYHLNEIPSGPQWMRFFDLMGIHCPTGSTATYDYDADRLNVTCTPNALISIDRLFRLAQNDIPGPLIQVEALLILYSHKDLELLARNSGITSESLMQMYRSGTGSLYASPSVVTRSGIAARASSCVECLYPTEFSVCPIVSSTNTGASILGAAAEPSSFNMREVGVVLDATPTMLSDGKIQTVLRLLSVKEPDWKDYGSSILKTNVVSEQLKMEVPFFRTFCIETQLSPTHGEFILVGGGGTDIEEKDKILYAFVRSFALSTSNQIPTNGMDSKPNH